MPLAKLSAPLPEVMNLLGWDTGGLAGSWATSSTFYLAPSVGTPVYAEVLQNISYTYDSVGNITSIVDNAGTSLGKTVSFAYDEWYRLVNASSTVASSTPFSVGYTYDDLGNISTFEGVSYLYAGTGYTNPHAVTSIAGIPQAYDRNGNLASTTISSYTWDYRNRLTRVGSTATTTFGYDHTQERVFKATGTATTTYASKLYNLDSRTPTKHVFTPQGDLIATIYGTSTQASTTFPHSDHLGGTSIVSDVNGDVRELSDFYPYGTPRVALNYTGTPEQRKFAGTERDETTSLDYMQARYYRAAEGRFISQDPVFYEVGVTRDGRAVLLNPIAQNSYAYDNPVGNKDPTGRISLADVASGRASFNDWTVEVGGGAQILSQQSAGWNFALGHPIAAGAIIGVTAGAGSVSTVQALVALKAAGVAGVGVGYASKQLFAAGVYGLSASGAYRSTQSMLADLNSANFSNPDAYYRLVFELLKSSGSSFLPEGPSAIVDALQFSSNLGSSFGGSQSASTPRTNTSAQTTQQSSGGGRLPATVTQNGVTYYRTSSGLLSTSPQK